MSVIQKAVPDRKYKDAHVIVVIHMYVTHTQFNGLTETRNI